MAAEDNSASAPLLKSSHKGDWYLTVDFVNNIDYPIRLCYDMYNDFDLFGDYADDNAQYVPFWPGFALWDSD